MPLGSQVTQGQLKLFLSTGWRMSLQLLTHLWYQGCSTLSLMDGIIDQKLVCFLRSKNVFKVICWNYLEIVFSGLYGHDLPYVSMADLTCWVHQRM
jgi:hypothetical protein